MFHPATPTLLSHWPRYMVPWVLESLEPNGWFWGSSWSLWKHVFHEGWFLFGMCHWFDIVTCHSLSLRITSFSSALWVWWMVVPALFVLCLCTSLSLETESIRMGVFNPGLIERSWGGRWTIHCNYIYGIASVFFKHIPLKRELLKFLQIPTVHETAKVLALQPSTVLPQF